MTFDIPWAELEERLERQIDERVKPHLEEALKDKKEYLYKALSSSLSYLELSCPDFADGLSESLLSYFQQLLKSDVVTLSPERVLLLRMQERPLLGALSLWGDPTFETESQPSEAQLSQPDLTHFPMPTEFDDEAIYQATDLTDAPSPQGFLPLDYPPVLDSVFSSLDTSPLGTREVLPDASSATSILSPLSAVDAITAALQAGSQTHKEVNS